MFALSAHFLPLAESRQVIDSSLLLLLVLGLKQLLSPCMPSHPDCAQSASKLHQTKFGANLTHIGFLSMHSLR